MNKKEKTKTAEEQENQKPKDLAYICTNCNKIKLYPEKQVQKMKTIKCPFCGKKMKQLTVKKPKTETKEEPGKKPIEKVAPKIKLEIPTIKVKPTEITVKITQESLDQMFEHAKKFCQPEQTREVIGLLIGATTKKTTTVIRAIPVTEGSEVYVNFLENHFQVFEKLELDEKKGEHVCGWYHSHPGLGIFLSPTDIETHKKSFQMLNPRAIAIVIDPTKTEQNALKVFTLKNPEDNKSNEYLELEWKKA
ncbi:MAG: Mov34/MPN/PAD-1 family protein [Candidatus Jordarchaeaceae archaeon]